MRNISMEGIREWTRALEGYTWRVMSGGILTCRDIRAGRVELGSGWGAGQGDAAGREQGDEDTGAGQGDGTGAGQGDGTGAGRDDDTYTRLDDVT